MDETQNQAVGDQALPIHPPLPLPNMDDLQEQLRQKDMTILRQESMLQKARNEVCRAEERAERAETLLDNKRDIVDGAPHETEEELQKRLADLYTQLEEARRGEEDLSTQLEVERRRRIDAERKTDAHKIENVEWKRRGQEAESVKDSLRSQNEKLKEESEEAWIEVKNLKDEMKQKCEVLEREIVSLNEQLEDFRRKMEDSIRNEEKFEVLEGEITSLKEQIDVSSLHQIDKLKNESEQARRVADDSKKTCVVLKGEIISMKEQVTNERRKIEESNRNKEALHRHIKRLEDELVRTKRGAEDSKKKLEREIASLKSNASEASKLTKMQQVSHTVQDHSLDERDGGDFGPVADNSSVVALPTADQAVVQTHAYQDGVKNRNLKEKQIESAKKKDENSRNPSSVIPSHSKAAQHKSSTRALERRQKHTSTDKSANSSYREIENNEYSTAVKERLRWCCLVFHYTGTFQISENLRNNPKARSILVEPNIYGIDVSEKVSKGDYIAELRGFVTFQNKFANRDLVPIDLNDHTFLLDKLFIIDARKHGNFARNLRKSCKPNAELKGTYFNHDFHCFIVAIKEITISEEVSIKLEDDWKKKPRPAQGCACKDKETCELERFFNQNNNNTGSTPRGGSTTGETKDGGRKRKMSEDAASTPIAHPRKKTVGRRD